MPVPGAERAIVEPRKIRDYLLSATHPVGRFKAAFFSSLGYTSEDWGQLASDLREFAHGDVTATEPNDFGTKYAIHAVLTGPNGRSATVVTVWVVLSAEADPRFVTAYPGDQP